MHPTVQAFLISDSFQRSINHMPVRQDIAIGWMLGLEPISTAWKAHPVVHRLLLQWDFFQVRISAIVP